MTRPEPGKPAPREAFFERVIAEADGEVPRFSDDTLADLPGLYPKGAPPDAQMLARRRQSSPWIRQTGDMAGLMPDQASPWKEAVPNGLGDAMLSFFDVQTLLHIDYRLRFCRATLSFLYPLWWTDEGEPYWEGGVTPPVAGHPFDALGVMGLNIPSKRADYFALKALRHFRRFELLADQGVPADNMSVVRELMLFGETWAEARAVVNFNGALSTGIRQRNWLSEARQESTAKARSKIDARRRAITQLLKETGRTGGSLEEWLMKELGSRYGLTASRRTIRRDLTALRG